MKIGLLSDVHSNLAALEAVLDAFSLCKIDRLVCLGDTVGYGSEPNECIELIRKHADVVVLGNHDCMALRSEMPPSINTYARQAMEWTRQVLKEEHKEWLRSLPYEAREEECYYVHASPRFPADWKYVGRLNEAIDAFDYFQERFCFLGHTHRAALFAHKRGEEARWVGPDVYAPSPDERMVVNIGSVGQPRDGDPRASSALWDGERIEILRTPYDVAKTQRNMKRKGLPSLLSERLGEGS